MENKEFTRRKSLFLINDSIRILLEGEHLINIYNQDVLVGTYQTSIRKTGRFQCTSDQIYFAGKNTPFHENPDEYGEFCVEIRNIHMGHFGITCHTHDCFTDMYYDHEKRKIRHGDNRRNYPISNYPQNSLYFQIEIIGGDYFDNLEKDKKEKENIEIKEV